MVLDDGSRASPIERLGLEEADERQLLGILGFKRRRRARRRQRLILTGLIGAMLALFMLGPVVWSFYGSFTNDSSLTPAQIAMLVQWINDGAPRGRG